MAMRLQKINASDVLLAFLVVAITTMLLIPLSPGLLDFLLAINLSFSILLLLVALYMKNALALLAFPSLLLLTTLFRLGLNVASTRLILSDGYAGEVIESFGSFLIRGDVVVGLIIFTIITMVNFIVVARGSQRVSEVAARFALDALPGKQMAIDSDLRAGLISATEASRRRDDLKKESQLYGAMDGAMKFVQGDVMAGLFIIFTNIFGGLYIGLRDNLELADAVQTYTTLTVGDGLVSQIPALLISICAGIVVTRISSGENATLGTDVSDQVLSSPGALVFSGILLTSAGLVPGLPTLPFVVVGLGFAGTGAWMFRKRSRADQAKSASSITSGRGTAVALLSSSSDLKLLDGPAAEGQTVINLALDPVLFRSFSLKAQEYRAWWMQFKAQEREISGLELPDLEVRVAQSAALGNYSLQLSGSPIESGSLVPDALFVAISPAFAEVVGIEVLREADHPQTGIQAVWSPDTPTTRAIVGAMGIQFYDFFQFLGLSLVAFFRRYPEEVLGMSEVHAKLKEIERTSPGLLADAINANFMNVARLTEVLQELVREGIGIRDFRKTIELIAGYCASFGIALDKDDAFDLDDLVSFVRNKRQRATVARLAGDRDRIRALRLGTEVEEWFTAVSVEREAGSFTADPSVFEKIRQGLALIVDPLRERGVGPVVIICAGSIRAKVARFLRLCNVRAEVVGQEELDPLLELEPIGIWGL